MIGIKLKLPRIHPLTDHRMSPRANIIVIANTSTKGAVGVLASIQGYPVCADIFDKSATLAAYWERLVRSYSIEHALRVTYDSAKISAEAFLQRVVKTQFRPFASPGMGSDVRIIDSMITGATLVCDGSAVHTALFPKSFAQDERSILRPSERRRTS
jgi:hypothetical protein